MPCSSFLQVLWGKAECEEFRGRMPLLPFLHRAAPEKLAVQGGVPAFRPEPGGSPGLRGKEHARLSVGAECEDNPGFRFDAAPERRSVRLSVRAPAPRRGLGRTSSATKRQLHRRAAVCDRAAGFSPGPRKGALQLQTSAAFWFLFWFFLSLWRCAEYGGTSRFVAAPRRPFRSAVPSVAVHP